MVVWRERCKREPLLPWLVCACGEGWLTRRASGAGDPSLRLKCGSAQDDERRVTVVWREYCKREPLLPWLVCACGEGWLTRRAGGAGDPSLRLKCGSAQDDERRVMVVWREYCKREPLLPWLVCACGEVWLTRRASGAGDPSLRLKCGSAQDDKGRVNVVLRDHPEAEPLPIALALPFAARAR